jgi:hypothetical protein
MIKTMTRAAYNALPDGLKMRDEGRNFCLEINPVTCEAKFYLVIFEGE